MNEFYYSAEPTSAHDEREIEIEALGVKSRCLTDAGVFSRDGLDTGTRAMLEALVDFLNLWATLIPLFFPRFAIALRPLFDKEKKEK